MVIHITTLEELATCIKDTREQLVVLDIYADWCGPCQRLAKALTQFEEEYNILLVKANIEEIEHGRERDENGQWKNPMLLKFAVKTIPHVVVWKNETELYVGDSNTEALEEVLKNN